MSNLGNQNKNKALGMPYGTATGRLRKIILFDFAQRLDEDFCYRCREKIINIDDFTIEHKVSWLFSDNPKEKFFNLDNIAFSHSLCNNLAANRTMPKIRKGMRNLNLNTSLCSKCGENKTLENFHKNQTKSNGLATECKACRRLRNV